MKRPLRSSVYLDYDLACRHNFMFLCQWTVALVILNLHVLLFEHLITSLLTPQLRYASPAWHEV